VGLEDDDSAHAAVHQVVVHRAALKTDPWNAQAYTALGLALKHVGQLDAAQRALSLALSLHPTEDILYSLAAVDGAAAVALLETLSSLTPSLVWLHVALAKLKADQGGSLPHVQTALRLAPEDAQLWALLGNCYTGAGKLAAATRAYAKSLELCCMDSTAAALLPLLDEAAADQLAEATFAREPKALWAATRVVAAFRRDGRLDEAAPALRCMLRASPADVDAWEELAAAYMANGRPGSAVAACAEALRLASRGGQETPAFAAAAASLLSLETRLPGDVEALATQAVHASPGCAAAHVALSRACFAAARTWARHGAAGLARDASLRARSAAAGAVAQPQGGCAAPAWKALGDAATAALLPSAGHKPGAHTATRAYAHAIHLAPNDAASWADCALAVHNPDTAIRLATTGLRVGAAGQVPPAGLWSAVASLVTSEAAQESALCHAVLLGGVAGSRAGAALARLYTRRAATPGPGDSEELLSAAERCLEQARSVSGADEAATLLATALLCHQRGNRDGALAALRSAVSVAWDAEACARHACLLLSPQDGNSAAHSLALVYASHAAAWRPDCASSAAAVAGALAARGLHAQAEHVYCTAAGLEAAGSEEAALLDDARRECEHDKRQAAAAAAGLRSVAMLCGKHVCQQLAPGRSTDALALHGAWPAVMVATVDACTLASASASQLVDRHLAHAVPTLPVAYARAVRDDVLGTDDVSSPSAWAVWTRLHAAAAKHVREAAPRRPEGDS
jgi:tetratricopeptide (TPR) repeat protein